MAINGVAIHPATIRPVMPQLTPRPPFNSPIPKMAPITACVLETGTKGMAGREWAIKKSLKDWDENKNKTRA